MDYILAGLIVIALGVLLRTVYLQAKATNRLIDLIGEQGRQAQDERRELINRAQFPDRMPHKATKGGMVQSNLSPEQRRALSSVGTVAPQRVTDGD